MKWETIIIHYSVLIDQPKEKVWDYTQDYNNRSQWDKSVIKATIIQTTPYRIVELTMKGNTRMTFIYKQDERPHKTSLVAKEVQSAIINKAGGSWSYAEQDGKTLWTQTNSIKLKRNLLLYLLSPLFKFIFTRQTKQAMENAKKILER